MKIISVLGQKGGISKSVISRALAVEAAKAKGARVALVDLDHKQKTATNWAAARRLNDLQPEIRVVGSVDDVGDATTVIIDTPGWTDAGTVQIASLSDLVVLPTGASEDDRRPVVDLAFGLEDAGIPLDRIVIVPSRMHSDAEANELRAYVKAASPQLEVLPVHLREVATYAEVAKHGLAITESRHEGPRGQADAVVKEIMRHLTLAGERPQQDLSKLDWSWLNDADAR
jgi:chromosome partitioning protein